MKIKLKETITQEQLDREVDIAKLSAELHAQEALTGGIDATAEELTHEMHKDKWEKSLQEAIANGKKQMPHQDFFIQIQVLDEKLVRKVQKCVFFPRSSAPTPIYDQVVYRYDVAADELTFLWCVPSKDIVKYMYLNKERVSPEEYDLLGHVISFVDGSLFRLVQKLNNEDVLKTGVLVEKLDD